MVFANSVGTASAQWLEVQTGIRSVAMSGAQAASGRGISAVFYNPANLSYIEGQEAFFNKTNYLIDISHSFLGYGRQLNDMELVGFNVFFLDAGDIERRAELNESDLGYYKAYNFLFQGTYAIKLLNDRFRVGVGFRYFREDIDNMHMQGFAFNAGMHYDLPLGFKIGASLNNLGPDIRFEGPGLVIPLEDSDYEARLTQKFPILSVARVGIESQLLGSERNALITNNVFSLVVATDIIKHIDYGPYGVIGAELSCFNMFFVRAGSHFGHDTAELSAGLGLIFKGFNVDYSVSQYEELGTTKQFGIGIKF